MRISDWSSDVCSSDLLLLTNDGALKRQLELPSSGWLRRYRVRAHGRVTAERLAALAKGVTVEGVDYGPVEATLDPQTGRSEERRVGEARVSSVDLGGRRIIKKKSHLT